MSPSRLYPRSWPVLFAALAIGGYLASPAGDGTIRHAAMQR